MMRATAGMFARTRKPYQKSTEENITMSERIDRATLEAKHGKVWSAEELVRDFIVTAFIGSTVVVRRRADDVVGTLEFTHRPHLFYSFQPQKGAE